MRLAITVLLLGCNLYGCASSVGEPGTGTKEDIFCRELLSKSTHREARAWVASASTSGLRTIGEQSPTTSHDIVARLYQMGALDVQAVEIQQVLGWGETTNTLIVKLPSDAAARKNLFTYEAEVANNEALDAVNDDGQELMLLYKFKLTISQIAKGLVGL